MERFEQMLSSAGENLGKWLPPLLILVGGWLVALLVRMAVRGALRRTRLDARLAQLVAGKERAASLDVAAMAGTIAYYTVLLFVAIAFLHQLGLSAVSGPIDAFLDSVFTFAPRALAAVGLLAAAWVIATLVRVGARKSLAALRVDERMGRAAGVEGGPSLSSTVSDTLYWLVFLLFLPAVLGTLSLSGLLGPVQTLMNELLGALPNVLGAVLIVGVGWFAARVVQRITKNLLAALGADRLGRRVGMKAEGAQSLSTVLSTVVYALILLTVSIAALEELGLRAVSEPASHMLTLMLDAVPHVFGAAIVLGVAYAVARLVGGLVRNVLTAAGFDSILARLGLHAPPEARETQRPSYVVGTLTVIAIMLFAAIEAARMLGFEAVASMVRELTTFGGAVLLGVVILGVGLYVANLAAAAVLASHTAHAEFLSRIARIAVLVLATAMGLRQMGLASDIINMAFGLLLGSLAVAGALAFGLGGRNAAADLLTRLQQNADLPRRRSERVPAE